MTVIDECVDQRGGLAVVQIADGAAPVLVECIDIPVVGSSRSRISGEGASTRASEVRRASPPERCAGSSCPVRPN
jgi:hypothetical protein